MPTKRQILKSAFAATAALLMTACATAPQQQAEFDIFLVRHAEKEAGSDPILTVAGQARAVALADLLEEAGITMIYSSDYRRTRQTAAPLAERLGLDVTLYDAGDLPSLASKLNETGGRVLVVGHSNTTPQLVELLNGDGGAPIVEATEYDRLYVLRRDANGNRRTVRLRYGDRTQ